MSPSLPSPAPSGWGVEVSEVGCWVPGDVVIRTLYRHAIPSFWLDSSRAAYGSGRWSYLGDASGPLAHVLTHRVPDPAVHVSDRRGPSREPGSIFDVLARRLAGRRLDPGGVPFDFVGGYVGWFGYELRADCGYDRGRHSAPTPDAWWLFADRFVALDHETRRAYVVVVHDGTPDVVAAGRDWAADAVARLRDAAQVAPAASAEPAPHTPARAPSREELAAAMVRGPRRYVADVERCLTHLRAGDSYEICLTDNLHLPCTGDDLEKYLSLRQANPAPYSALLRTGDATVFCSSPERFLSVDRDGHAQSKPIKGTVPRSADPVTDAARAAALAADPKARAENLMIVDLLRNDLSGVCRPETVRVDPFLAVESYASVHQLVSTVHGELRPGVSALDCAYRCFPAGSMTGAPKHRTLNLIDDLEDEARGVYSGSIGWLGLDGALDLNVVIRTAVRIGDEAIVGAGGAVVLDSDPDDELSEMLLKAAAPVGGLGLGPGVQPAIRVPAPGVDGERCAGVDSSWTSAQLPVGVPLARVRGRWVRTDPVTPLAIDSWRVVDGAVRRLDLHLVRFGAACRRLGYADPDQVSAFVLDALTRLPPRGDFFPRVELVSGGPAGPELRFVVRPSPPVTHRVSVWTAGVSEATDLRLKGADLAYLADCRERARGHGADEAILLDADGHLLEGATTALLWWRGDTAHVVASPEVLDSVTLRLVCDLAAHDGIEVRRVDARPGDLAGAELWVLNALHGIRAVDAWVGADVPLAPPVRRDAWQRRLDDLRQPVGRR